MSEKLVYIKASLSWKTNHTMIASHFSLGEVFSEFSSLRSHLSRVPAKCSTDLLFKSSEWMSVPASKSRVTTGTWLEMIARWMGRLLTQSRIFGLAPCCNRSRTRSKLPLELAMCRHVRCLSSIELTSCTLCSRRSLTLRNSLFCT